MRCTKAIIPVGGYGTRGLPITKSIEKCMLPIGNRPIIDYVVQDCIAAGIEEIYFVVAKGGGQQLKSYYTTNPALEAHLRAKGKEEFIPLITPPQNVKFYYAEQDMEDHARYGTAVPVWLCREFVRPDEHVLVLMGDDFLYNPDGSSEVARLVEAVEKAGTGSALIGVPIPKEDVSRYGVIATHEEQGILRFDHIQEKPSIEEAKSNLINVSKYLLEASFFEHLDRYVQHHSAESEYYITDPLNDYVEANNVLQVVMAQGTYLDSGNPESWLRANNFVAQNPAKR